MYVLSNVATGKESHKEAVMNQLLPQAISSRDPFFVIRFLQSNDSRLRTATVWALLNVTCPSSDPGVFGRYIKLQAVGIITQIKSMINDPCLDVKVIPSSLIVSHLFQSSSEPISNQVTCALQLRVCTMLETYASFGGS